MTAILAIATLHQSRISCQSDSHKAMVIHDRCLSMIVPMLGDSDRANDDCVLMTTTILHLYDGLESMEILKMVDITRTDYSSSSWQ